MRLLGLLRLVQTNLTLFLLLPHGLEVRDVSAVRGQFGPVEVRHVRHNLVEEVAVVRHHHERAHELCGEVPFQPKHGLQIEMVSGLIEQQQGRVGEECAGERHAHAPPPRQFPRGLVLHIAGEAEAGQHLPRAWLRVSPLGLLDLRQPLVGLGQLARESRRAGLDVLLHLGALGRGGGRFLLPLRRSLLLPIPQFLAVRAALLLGSLGLLFPAAAFLPSFAVLALLAVWRSRVSLFQSLQLPLAPLYELLDALPLHVGLEYSLDGRPVVPHDLLPHQEHAHILGYATWNTPTCDVGH
mmetsp:Transcript_33748/g.100680  ORF Transcript_33748/g.100680 Transcript_33748/m.100680 type:complete len:297 (+) Transcript_33748:948-1838(+)